MRRKGSRILIWGIIASILIGFGLTAYQINQLHSRVHGPLPVLERPLSVLTYLPDSVQIDSIPDIDQHPYFQRDFDPTLFSSPPAIYKPWTRWWWPGNLLHTDSLVQNLKSLEQQGFGGVEIQSFTAGTNLGEAQAILDDQFGFDQPEYFQHLQTVLDAAAQLDMQIDLTAGSGWPSGGAHIALEDNLKSLVIGEAHVLGGKLIQIPIPPPQTPASYYLMALVEPAIMGEHGAIIDFFPDQAELQYLYAAKPRGGKRSKNRFDLTDCVQIDPDSLFILGEQDTLNGHIHWEAPKGYWKLIAVYSIPTGSRPVLSAQKPQGFVLNPFDSARVNAHYHYLFRDASGISRYSGKSLRGFFNDSYEYTAERIFSKDFPTEFENRRGYELAPYLLASLKPAADHYYLDALQFKRNPYFKLTEEDARIRYDYRKTISDLFIDRFLKPSQQWAEKRGMLHRSQIYGLPLDVIQAARSVHIPETEQLYGGGSHMFLKLVSSGAHIYDKPVVSAEAFVHPNKDYSLTPYSLKVAADKLFVAGINHIIAHGSPYSLKGKEYGLTGWAPFSNPFSDFRFSGNLSPANPFWPQIKQINRYISRCQYALRQGKARAEIALFYPFLGFPGAFANSQTHKEIYFNGSFPDSTALKEVHFPGMEHEAPRHEAWFQSTWDLIGELESHGLNWDWMNEDALLSAKWENDRFYIGDQSYQLLILPDLPFISLELALYLDNLRKNGARIQIYKNPPSKQPGYFNYLENDPIVQEIMATFKMATPFEKPGDLADYLTGHPIGQAVEYSQKFPFLRQYKRKMADESHMIFYYNQDQNEHYIDLVLHQNFRQLYWLNPWDGNIQEALPDSNNRIRAFLGPHASLILYASNQRPLADSLLHHQLPLPEFMAQNRPLKTHPLPNWQLIVPNPKKPEALTIKESVFFDWRDHKQLKSQHHHGVYTTYFEMGDTIPGKKYILDLGKVEPMAEIYVNTELAGQILFPPYLIDISPYISPGFNSLEIWVNPPLINALIGKAESGDDQYNRFSKEAQRMPVGLFGPVQLWELDIRTDELPQF